jgi:hypothetical protein
MMETGTTTGKGFSVRHCWHGNNSTRWNQNFISPRSIPGHPGPMRSGTTGSDKERGSESSGVGRRTGTSSSKSRT